MTLKEAYKILGVSKENTDREIKAKYKKLLIMYHPDSDPTGKRAPEDDEKIRQIIEAYKKIRETESETYLEPYEFTWDAFENKRAFSERNIFFQFKIYDEALPPSKMARGRFVWDPDMEEFPLFAKSVLEACKEVMTDHDVTLTPDKVKNFFHLMMQEYILPTDAARKIGKKIKSFFDMSEEIAEKFMKCFSKFNPESIKNEYYTDLLTHLKDDIHVEHTIPHFIYANKMGEKYLKRYTKYFRNPDIREFDMQHEQWLFFCYSKNIFLLEESKGLYMEVLYGDD